MSPRSPRFFLAVAQNNKGSRQNSVIIVQKTVDKTCFELSHTLPNCDQTKFNVSKLGQTRHNQSSVLNYWKFHFLEMHFKEKLHKSGAGSEYRYRNLHSWMNFGNYLRFQHKPVHWHFSLSDLQKPGLRGIPPMNRLSTCYARHDTGWLFCRMSDHWHLCRQMQRLGKKLYRSRQHGSKFLECMSTVSVDLQVQTGVRNIETTKNHKFPRNVKRSQLRIQPASPRNLCSFVQTHSQIVRQKQ